MESIHMDVRGGVSYYVDCVRWVGGLLLSRGSDGRAVLWEPPRPDLGLPGAKHSSEEAASASPPSRDSAWSGRSVSSTDGSCTRKGACERDELPLNSSLAPGFKSSSTARDNEGNVLRRILSQRRPTLEGSNGLFTESPPDASDETGRDHAHVVSEAGVGCSAGIWFLRFNLDPSRSLLALGNTRGETIVWDIDSMPASKRARSAKPAGCAKPANVAEGTVAARPLPPPTPVARLCTPGNALGRRVHASTVRHTAISHDGRRLVCCHDDGSIIVWELPVRNEKGTAAKCAHAGTCGAAPRGGM